MAAPVVPVVPAVPVVPVVPAGSGRRKMVVIHFDGGVSYVWSCAHLGI